MIHELGFISCCNRDDILSGLESIEDDIAKGRFEWRENKDVRSNIVEALVQRVGEPARKLDATISQYVQKLTILRLWFHDSVDTIVNQIEQLQVELVLLALRNWGFVVPLLFRRTDWILLGEFIFSKVELLEKDVSRLRSCKNEIDSTLLVTFPLCSADGYLDRLSNDGSHLLQNAVVNFGNMVIGDIAIDISSLKQEISYWISFRFLAPNDGVRESFSFLEKNVSDLSMFTTIQRDFSFTCYGLQDTCQRFFAVYIIVQQILKAATDFAKHASFDNKKVQSFPSIGYIKTGSSDIHTVKLNLPKQVSDKDQIAKATQDFRSRSDEVMKSLLD
ncbi:hypothetical protein HU200_010247 [Digitaria exilis]|uniref:Uncharacterized protein n=1 Tax=Digitaria exilis TaxID=1010633 RepID=A0A835FJM3_9POAL|nr:hypothetical protein HU200_010247 [Digitaria exilis]